MNDPEPDDVAADRRYFELDRDQSRAFQAAIDRPPVFKPRLSDLLREEGPFQ